MADASHPIAEAAGQVAKKVVEKLPSGLDKLANVSADVLADCAKWLKGTAHTVMAQVPDVLHQYLMWKMAEAIINCVMWMLFGGMFFVLANKMFKYHKTRREDSEDWITSAVVGWLLTALGTVVMLIAVSSYLPDMAKIYLAPKVYLLESFMELYKQYH